VLIALSLLAGYESTTISCPNCGSNVANQNYYASSLPSKSSPITGLSTTASNYAPNGLYYSVSSVNQCCYNCYLYTSSTCTSFTFIQSSCGTNYCFLSNMTSTSLIYSTGSSSSSMCPCGTCTFQAGFITSPAASATTTTAANTATTTTTTAATTTAVATTTATYTCFVFGTGQNIPGGDSNPQSPLAYDIAATTSSNCCNYCGGLGAAGYAWLPPTSACSPGSGNSVYGGCWCKSAVPNPNTAAAASITTSTCMELGAVTGTGK